MRRRPQYTPNLLMTAVAALLLSGKPGLGQSGIVDPRTLCVPLEIHQGSPQEKPCLNELRDAVERSGDTLTLKLGNGKTKVIRNSKECKDPAKEDECVSYALVGYLGERYFLVDERPYECGSVLLIDRQTGEQTVLGGWPTLSPNKKRFVVTASAVSGECNPPYGTAIFSLKDDQPRVEWQSQSPGDLEDFYYDGWDGDEHLFLRWEREGRHTRVQLKLTAQGWTSIPYIP